MSSDDVSARSRLVLESMRPGVTYDTQQVAAEAGLTIRAARVVLVRLVRGRLVCRIGAVQQGALAQWQRRK